MKALILVLALMTLAAHVWLSRELYHGPNRALLTNAVQPGIDEEYEGVSVRYDYLDGILEGVVSSDEERRKVEARAGELRPAGRIVNRLRVRDQPATFFAIKDRQGAIRISGKVPRGSFPERMEAVAKESGGKVINAFEMGDTVREPSWFGGMPDFVKRFFEGEGPAEIEVETESIRLRRSVRSSELRGQLLAEAAGLGLSPVDEMELIRDQPPGLTAVLKDGELLLGGRLPGEELKSRVERNAARSGRPVTNGIAVKETVIDPVWEGKIGDWMGDFFREPASAELEIGADRVRMAREVGTAAEKESWAAKGRALLPGAEFVDELRVPEKPREFAFVMARSGEEWQLSGWLPSVEMRDGIVEAARARFPEGKIVNQLAVIPGLQVPEWGSLLPVMVGAIGKDASGTARFDADGLSLAGLSGAARSQWEKPVAEVIGAKFPSFRIPVFGVDVARSDRSLTLQGWLSDPALKKSLLDGLKKKSPDLRIVDRLRVEPGLPEPAWAGALPEFFGAISGWDDIGGFRFVTGGLEFPDLPEETRTRLGQLAMATMKNGFPRPDFPEPRPALPAKAGALLAGNSLTLTGQVPSEALKKSLVTEAARSLPGVKIDDRLTVSDRVAPPVWEKGVPGLLVEFFAGGPEKAELQIDQETIRMNRVLSDEKTKKGLLARVSRVFPEGRLIDELTVSPPVVVAAPPKTMAAVTPPTVPPEKMKAKSPPPPKPSEPAGEVKPKAMEKTLPKPAPAPKAEEKDGVIGRHAVYFATGNAKWINPAGERELKKVVELLDGGKGTESILIRGFADIRGDSEMNRILSEIRARTILNRLVTMGVDRSQITTEAFGEEEAKDWDYHRDRRVEIIVTK